MSIIDFFKTKKGFLRDFLSDKANWNDKKKRAIFMAILLDNPLDLDDGIVALLKKFNIQGPEWAKFKLAYRSVLRKAMGRRRFLVKGLARIAISTVGFNILLSIFDLDEAQAGTRQKEEVIFGCASKVNSMNDVNKLLDCLKKYIEHLGYEEDKKSTEKIVEREYFFKGLYAGIIYSTPSNRLYIVTHFAAGKKSLKDMDLALWQVKGITIYNAFK